MLITEHYDCQLMLNTHLYKLMNLKTLALFIGFAFFSLNLLAQPLVDDTKTYEVLVFEHVEKEQTKFIRSGGHIKLRLYSNPKLVYQGTLIKVTESSIIIDVSNDEMDEVEIKLKDCSMIAGRVRTSSEISGGIMLGMGTALAPFGAAIINLNNIVGPAIIVGGVAMISTGIYFITKKKSFRMTKGWTVHGGKLTFSRAEAIN
jgi:hypothetical protein